ncbi:sulfite exporter TauE/SafE family protein [Salinactinospora qingdaonensis]|uniref:Probable membrane transporter protein n=1 Tax=Salinactinospora qingdaonensis TaxID=702744 RepID=A0ABP7EYY5_9ACTN
MSTVLAFVIMGSALLVGAMVQSSVGLGLGLVGAPVISLVDPTLMPATLLIGTAALPMFTIGSEWRHIDWRGISWGLAGRLLGTGLGVAVVASLDPKTLGAAIGAMVLAAVAVSLWRVHVRITPWSLVIAGAVSGTTGTATSIGGPPMALLYQRESGPTVRSTLAGYFVVGTIVSLAALALGGQFEPRQAGMGLALLPFIIAGFLLGRPLRHIIDAGRLRVALLAVVTVSGTVLLIQSLL